MKQSILCCACVKGFSLKRSRSRRVLLFEEAVAIARIGKNNAFFIKSNS